MTDPADLVTALKAEYANADGGLRELHDRLVKRMAEALPGVTPYSIGTLGRLVNGQTPEYRHLVQIAVLCGMDAPELPLELQAQGVSDWQKVGDGPAIHGLLLDHGGKAEITPSDNGGPLVVSLVRPRTSTVRKRQRGNVSYSDSLRDAMLALKSELGESWEQFGEAALKARLRELGKEA